MLSPRERRHLKSLAHHLDPTVRIGKGKFSPEVLAEAERSIEAHELIKVKIDAGEREELATTLSRELHADFVGLVGKIAMLYRARAEKPRIILPKNKAEV
jgi:RNA-binding protein